MTKDKTIEEIKKQIDELMSVHDTYFTLLDALVGYVTRETTVERYYANKLFPNMTPNTEVQKKVEEVGDAVLMLETTLGYLDSAKHHNIDKHNKVVGELLDKVIHHCEVSQRMLTDIYMPKILTTREKE